jgi:hypothetical protein
MGLKLAACRVSRFVMVATLATIAQPAWAQMPLFKGAEGFGGTFTGERAGRGLVFERAGLSRDDHSGHAGRQR